MLLATEVFTSHVAGGAAETPKLTAYWTTSRHLLSPFDELATRLDGLTSCTNQREDRIEAHIFRTRPPCMGERVQLASCQVHFDRPRHRIAAAAVVNGLNAG